MHWPFLFVAALYSLSPVTISVYPTYGMRPATFRITVLVPRHVENRKICWQVEGPERKGSCEDLAGWESRRSWTVWWDLRTAGEYQATAELTRMTAGKAERFTSQQPFRVIGVEP